MPLDKPKTETPTNKPPPEDRAIAEARLNQAASDLLEQLPDHAGQLVHSLAKQYQMPLWQYTSGILLAVHLEGRLSEFRIDPAWREGLKTKTLICKQCKKEFTPKHINQPYCCNECGIAANQARQPKKDIHHAVRTLRSKLSADHTPSGAGWATATP
jgi:hypothetical protein